MSMNNLGVSPGSMSLDSYTGSVDHAIANLHIGRQGGINEGMQKGYDIGYQEGHAVGWDAGIDAANVETLKAVGYIEQHVKDKEFLQQELIKQNIKIQELEAKVRTLENQNVLLRDANNQGDGLINLVTSLKNANFKLQQDLAAANEKLVERTNQYAEQIWQYNRSLVFMNAVRGVLDEITSSKNEDADKVRTMFVEKYNAEIEKGLEFNNIKSAPHNDASFEKALPRTNQFILKMLASVNKEIDFEREPETGSWLYEESP